MCVSFIITFIVADEVKGRGILLNADIPKWHFTDLKNAEKHTSINVNTPNKKFLLVFLHLKVIV